MEQLANCLTKGTDSSDKLIQVLWGLDYHEAISGELKGGLYLLLEPGLRESGMACAIH